MRQIRWIGSPPAFVEVRKQRGTGRLVKTGRKITGMDARKVQYQLDAEHKRLPNGWIRDWFWETRHDGKNGAGLTQGGRRHAMNAGPDFDIKRIITVDDSFNPEFRHTLQSLFPEITWHPLSVPTYVWSNLDNYTTDVYDDDAALILFGCYGEFVDITTNWIKDDVRVFHSANLVGTKPAQAAGSGSTGLVGIRR